MPRSNLRKCKVLGHGNELFYFHQFIQWSADGDDGVAAILETDEGLVEIMWDAEQIQFADV